MELANVVEPCFSWPAGLSAKNREILNLDPGVVQLAFDCVLGRHGIVQGPCVLESRPSGCHSMAQLRYLLDESMGNQTNAAHGCMVESDHV